MTILSYAFHPASAFVPVSAAERAAQQRCVLLYKQRQQAQLRQQAQDLLQRYPQSLRSALLVASLLRSHDPKRAVQILAPHWQAIRTHCEMLLPAKAHFHAAEAELLEACAVEYARSLHLIRDSAAAIVVLECALHFFAPLRTDHLQQQYNAALSRPLPTYPTLGECSQPLAMSSWELATLHLSLGHWAAGFSAYEARLWWWQHRGWHSPDLQALRQRPWPGIARAPLRGKRILVMGEQGYGDQLMFWRFLPRLKALGAEVILGVNSPLKRLATMSYGAILQSVVALGDAIAPCDYWAPLGSLPHLLGLTRRQELAMHPWPVTLQGRPARPLRVGLCFAGKATHGSDAVRSLPWALLAPWLQEQQQRWGDQVHWVRVQPQWQAHDTPELAAEDSGVQDFLDLAVLLLSLDLLISVDSAPVHLAGYLHIPTLMLDRAPGHLPDWRWGLHQPHPEVWYPQLQLARQTQPDDWTGPLAQAATKVEQLLQRKT